MNRNRWLLPEGIAELLPPAAQRVEHLRRRVLDLFAAWGYELVEPPLVEYLESLLTGMGRDLDIQTFKLVDQHNGRAMGVRADITPQVARIDAHQLNRDLPTRLCYLGPVLHARGDEFGGNRNPLQVGAELYGHTGVESDLEVIELMLETLALAGLDRVYLDLGHVGIFRGLVEDTALDTEAAGELFDMLQRKSAPEVRAFVDGRRIASPHRAMIARLVDLNGTAEVLARAREALRGAGAQVHAALDYLAAVGERLAQARPGLVVHYDLAEFRAYHYQTGLVFAAYREGHGQEIARGGRYDDVGAVFGRARPATGFSTDLRLLAGAVPVGAPGRGRIFAPPEREPALERRIGELRAAGECVVRALPGQSGGAQDMGCTRALIRSEDGWTLETLR